MKQLVLFMCLISPVFISAAPQTYVNHSHKIAMEGYDPVSYFKEPKPVLGRPNYEVEYNGTTYRFANEENKEDFQSNPQAFAPQYGGFCPHAIASGHKVEGTPQIWAIDEGKLYLLCSYEGLQTWSEDGRHIKQLADQKWRENSAPAAKGTYSGRPVSQANPSARY